ncbi:hypothetical protein GX50_01017 [[Emmonsia] crescens]|uniref:Uncharacterized protein n=1 Tax=[Emmonsia] crescens TaxID=73230 RepID=A0A2B7ZT29_9EURO|nr:hypothetical protein GX50_01017 [Emmonsia crescens]
MGTFTCKETSDAVVDQHQRLSPIHMREDSITSPFLYVPCRPQNDDKLNTSVDAIVPTHYTGEPDATQPCFSISSDAKAYYTAVEATDVTMQQGRSPAISELGPLTPGTTFSTTSNETGPEEFRGLIKTSTDSSALSNTSSRSRNRIHRESKPNASRSRTSSCSTGRSQDITSRSSSANRRKSSKHQSHKAGTYAQIHSPTLRKGDSVLSYRREDLVSLHRNSCRIFEAGKSKLGSATDKGSQDSKHTAQRSKLDRSHTARTDNSAFTNRITSCCTASPSLAPLLTSTTQSSPTSPSFPDGHATPETERSHNWDPVIRNSSSHDDLHLEYSQEYKPIPATVIDWTSPSTRRREYEKIDRSTRGVRGMWRRIAPGWCQPGGSRMPFFEEGKGGRGMYEGSVRRFRMDVPDGENNDSGGGGDDFTKDGGANNPGGNEKAQQSSKAKWKWIEGSISPTGSVRDKDTGDKGGIHGKWRYLSIMRKTN